MADLKRFRKDNNLRQEDLVAFWGVTSKSFVSQVETGKCPLPADRLSELLSNDRGWDTSALTTSVVAPKITAKLTGGSMIFNNSPKASAGNREELIYLRERIKQLEQDLAEEKARSERYLAMMEKMMGK